LQAQAALSQAASVTPAQGVNKNQSIRCDELMLDLSQSAAANEAEQWIFAADPAARVVAELRK
jgi:hypothetical protein